MSEKRDLKADLEEWHSDLISGTRKIDWFYLVDNYIDRAIKAEAELSALRGCNSLLEEVLRQKVLLLDEIAELRQNFYQAIEENDIQRQAIQNLSAQVVGLREGLRNFVEVEATRKLGKCKKCGQAVQGEQINYCYICSVEIAKGLLATPDPGEKYRKVVEATKEHKEYLCDKHCVYAGQKCTSCDYHHMMNIKQALASLEGGIK